MEETNRGQLEGLEPSGPLSAQRVIQMLTTALGPSLGELLTDPTVIELMLNPDGKLWIDRLGEGRLFSGHTMAPADAERLIFIVASAIKASCSKDNPMLSAELPGIQARFQGILPPISANPVFTIRKRAVKIFSLHDYVSQGIITKEQQVALKQSVIQRKNILIVGGTGSGKTTLANALLEEIAKTEDRIVIIEDTQELQCNAKDVVNLRTREKLASMTDLLKATMRLRPDRIVIGEVRGPEALALLKAWNTGHPGGCATVHADSARKGLSRLEQLVREAGVLESKQLIAEAVNRIAFIERTQNGRKLKEFLGVEYGEDGNYKVSEI